MHMKNIFIVVLVVFAGLFVSQSGYCQDEEQSKKLNIKMSQAWLRISDGDYHGALRIYRDLLKEYKTNALLNYRMGECHLELKEYNEALTYFTKAYKLDPEVDTDIKLNLGKVLQYTGKLDKAIKYYYEYKATLKPRQLERHYVNQLLRQSEIAKDILSKPVDVEIENLGTKINSKYVDAAPSITADGQTLIFTSRRPDERGTNIDPATGEYYDDVYISKWNKKDKSWSETKPIPGYINTGGHDANLSISPDGSKIFLYKNIEGETNSGDIYYSELQENGTWGKPMSISNEKYINSSYFESSACITADGNKLFFVSERERVGFGRGDIYVSEKVGNQWGKPQNLGPKINTEYDEIGVFIHPDGKTLFFTSEGHNSIGGYDIFMSVYENDEWSAPINLGYPINSIRDEYHFVLNTEGTTAYISSSREGGTGKIDIYKVDMTKYFNKSSGLSGEKKSALTGPTLSIVKGSVVDNDGKPVQTSIRIKNLSDNIEDKVISSNEKGMYFVTLPADKKYKLIVEDESYKEFEITVKLPKGKDGGTHTEIKHLILNKK